MESARAPGRAHVGKRQRTPAPARAMRSRPPSRVAERRAQRGASRRATSARRHASARAHGFGGPKGEAIAATRLRVGVDDRVGQPTGRAHDGHGPVAHGDHLALAAGLEARGHQEHVGAGIHAPCEATIETIDDGQPASSCRARRESLQATDERVVARSKHTYPGAVGKERGGRLGEQVEALLRIEPADHGQQRAVALEPELGRQCRAANLLAVQVGRRVARRDLAVGGRIPELAVDAVDDAQIAPAERAQRVVDAGAIGRFERLPGVRRRDGVDQVRGQDAFAQQVHAVRRADARRQAKLAGHLGPRHPAVIGQVVAGQHRRPARPASRRAA